MHKLEFGFVVVAHELASMLRFESWPLLLLDTCIVHQFSLAFSNDLVVSFGSNPAFISEGGFLKLRLILLLLRYGPAGSLFVSDLALVCSSYSSRVSGLFLLVDARISGGAMAFMYLGGLKMHMNRWIMKVISNAQCILI